jgi:phosphoesterase RecJ-like protein
MIDSAALIPVVDAIRSADTIGVVGHVGPDGDALGSMVALALAATENGKTGFASFAEPFVVPEEMSYLETSVLVAPSAFPTDLDLAVAVDTSVRHRVGSLAGAMEQATTLAVIDHHISDGSWGDVVAIDPAAAATTELVYRILKQLDWAISQPVATALYTGLVTDTGRFQYSSTSPQTHEIAADLLACGVEPDVIGQKLFEETPFGYYAVAAAVLKRSIMDVDHEFVWSMLTMDDLEDAGVAYHEVDGLIDLVRMARGTQVACLLKEAKPGVIKGSLRSRGIVDVSAIAGTFGGGGHHNASGFTSSDSPADIVEQIVSQL